MATDGSPVTMKIDTAMPPAGGTGRFYELASLPEAGFGALMRFPALSGAREAVAALEAEPAALGDAICARGGLLMLPGMHGISEEPELLLRLSRLLGPEVEDYRNSYSFEDRSFLFNYHETVPEIIQITNLGACAVGMVGRKGFLPSGWIV